MQSAGAVMASHANVAAVVDGASVAGATLVGDTADESVATGAESTATDVAPSEPEPEQAAVVASRVRRRRGLLSRGMPVRLLVVPCRGTVAP